MEMPNFENRAERGEEGLRKQLKEIAAELKESGIGVDDECRINMEAYRNEPKYANSVVKDKAEVADMEKTWKEQEKRASAGIIDAKTHDKKNRSGEQMEMFKTALFNKAIGGKFFVLRSSRFDDYKHGIDNIIVEKETGAVVGAFDEVVSRDGELDKGSKIRAINGTKGGYLKYGVGLENGKATKQENARIPLFYLALTYKELENAISSFESDQENLSELEKKLLKKLADSVKEQIEPISKIGMLKNKIPDIEKFSAALQEAIESKNE